MGDASQNPSIYNYADTMRATGFKFYTQFLMDIKVLLWKDHQNRARHLIVINKNHARAKYLK